MRAKYLRQAVVVEQAFALTGRGVAVVISGTAADLPFGRPISATVHREHGASLEATAWVELLHRTRKTLVERTALRFPALELADLPVGCTIDLFEADG